MRVGSSFESALTGLLSASGLVPETAPYANGTTSSLVPGTATPPPSPALASTAKVISVTNTTLITKVLGGEEWMGVGGLDAQIKVQKTSCVPTQVPTAVSCTTKANADGKSKTSLEPGKDYGCSTNYKSTTMCYAAIGDEDATAFTGASMTYTDVYTKSGLLVKVTQTSYQQANATGSSTSLDHVDVIIDDDLKNDILAMAEQQCLLAGFTAHKGGAKRGIDGLLTCNPLEDLPMPVQMQLEAQIAGHMQQGFMMPAAWVQYWLLNGITRNQINIALWSIMGLSVLEAINEMGHGLGSIVPVKQSDINAALNRLGIFPSPTPTGVPATTTDPCAMCKKDSAACYVDPNDPQGEDGTPPIWPFPTLNGVITTALNFKCHQNIAQQNSQTWCNCAKSRFVKHPMTYTSSYKGSTTILTENCPYTTDAPDQTFGYMPPTDPPVSSPLIVTAAITNTFKCSLASSSMGEWQKTWCACPDGKGYAMTKHVYGIAKSGSTSWTTSTCGYTAPPPSMWIASTTPPPVTAVSASEAAITDVANVNKPGTYMKPMNGKYQKYDTVHWNLESATSIASKFCSQMSVSSKTYIGSDANTLIENHKFWNGAPTARSYPVPTDHVAFYPEYKNPKALAIRLSHDENACNSTQKTTGCKFNFQDKERCEHWLLTALDSCDTDMIYDYYDSRLRQPFDMAWVPRIKLSGDGIVRQFDEGERCTQPQIGAPLNEAEDAYCFSKPYLEA